MFANSMRVILRNELQTPACMADVFSKRKRSDVMSRIRSRGNKGTELALAKIFRAQRITGWRRQASVFGRPDFIFAKPRVALFVDGCFWHGCPKHATCPKNNREFWRRKLAANRARDARVTRTLRRAGWRVVRVWEHELAWKHQARLLNRIRRALAPRGDRASRRVGSSDFFASTTNSRNGTER